MSEHFDIFNELVDVCDVIFIWDIIYQPAMKV